MSNTIRAHHYTARQAALLQGRPGELIEAAENVQGAYSSTLHVLYDHDNIQRANISVVGVDGASRAFATGRITGGQVVRVSTSFPTTLPEVFVDLDEYQVDDSWTRWTGQVKDAFRRAASPGHRQSTASARLRVEQLSAVQAAFGFTILDLATVLGITRPQLYKWLDSANDVKLQEANRVRLGTVERLAKGWMSRSKAPLSSVSKELLNDGGSVHDLMCANPLNETAVISAFDELLVKVHGKPKSRSERLREAGFTRRPSARSLPSDE